MAKKNHKPSDEELIKAILQEGKTEFFGILYDRYSNKVYRKCLSFFKDEMIAQDMVQDIFLKVFFQLAKFKGRSRFSTWLYAITYNYCVEYYRRNSKYSTVEVEDHHVGASDDTEEDEILEYRVGHLKRALEMVAIEDKMILLMKYQDDTSIKEIMEHLKISESAVKMRLARARTRVRNLIQEMEKEELNA